MPPIEFSTVLPEAFREDLEYLLYFNPLQSRATSGICRSVDRYGQPRVAVVDGVLTVALTKVGRVQTLFAVMEDAETCELAGVALFVRESDRLVILHLAVGESFAGNREYGPLALRLALAIRRIGKRLTGVTRVVPPYARQRALAS
jgi:hypothetical protein